MTPDSGGGGGGGGEGGEGVVDNDVLKKIKIIEFQSLCTTTSHLCKWSISRDSNRQVI